MSSLLLVGQSILSFGQVPTPEDYRWKNRLILLFAPAGSDTALQQQVAVLTEKKGEVTDRDLLYFQIHPDSPEAVKLFRGYEVARDGFTLLLIGKDGGVKLRSRKVVPFMKIADLIDGMPMRRAEMRRRSG